MLAISIIIINMIIYYIIIGLVKKMGFIRRNSQEEFTCMLIVICYMLSMVGLPIMLSINFQEADVLGIDDVV